MKRLLDPCRNGIVLVICLAAVAAPGQPPEKAPGGPPPARPIPGLTAADAHPQGCVDCHLNYTEMNLDTRFSTLMGRWSEQVEPGLLAKSQAAAPAGMTLKGKHPRSETSLTDIPAQCTACHKDGSRTAPPFGPLMHTIHLTGEGNHYLSIFQGECTHCHKFAAASGQWTLPSGPEK